jgi:hypothetical protein
MGPSERRSRYAATIHCIHYPDPSGLPKESMASLTRETATPFPHIAQGCRDAGATPLGWHRNNKTNLEEVPSGHDPPSMATGDREACPTPLHHLLVRHPGFTIHVRAWRDSVESLSRLRAGRWTTVIAARASRLIGRMTGDGPWMREVTSDLLEKLFATQELAMFPASLSNKNPSHPIPTKSPTHVGKLRSPTLPPLPCIPRIPWFPAFQISRLSRFFAAKRPRPPRKTCQIAPTFSPTNHKFPK